MKIKHMLIVIAIGVLSAVAMRAATPVDAADGVDIAATSPVKQVRWMDGATMRGNIYTTNTGFFYLHGGNGAAQLSITPGDINEQYMYLSAWSNNSGGVTIYNGLTEVDGILSATYIHAAELMEANDLNVDDDVNIAGDTAITGTVSASNLSGTNTGDQTIDLMIGGNGANGQTAASSTTYMGPYFTGAPETGEYDVIWNAPKVCTLSSLYVRTRSTQPATGNLVFTVRLDNSNTSITATVAAGGAATLISDTTHSATIAYAGQRVSISVVNNATSSSAKIASWSLSCAAD